MRKYRLDEMIVLGVLTFLILLLLGGCVAFGIALDRAAKESAKIISHQGGIVSK
jgi:hypothetical protein